MNQVVLFILNIFYIQLYLFRDESIAVETPVIAGGIFAVHKDWFVRLGLYDEGMQVSKEDFYQNKTINKPLDISS